MTAIARMDFPGSNPPPVVEPSSKACDHGVSCLDRYVTFGTTRSLREIAKGLASRTDTCMYKYCTYAYIYIFKCNMQVYIILVVEGEGVGVGYMFLLVGGWFGWVRCRYTILSNYLKKRVLLVEGDGSHCFIFCCRESLVSCSCSYTQFS